VRDLTIFTTTLPFDDEKVGVPHDVFSVSQIVVNKGDTVRIHLYNTEAEPEDHTFVMDSPYAMRYTLHQGDKADIVFAAGTAGTFAYKCDLHQPTMTGYLTVLG
jgi:plastocyanin